MKLLISLIIAVIGTLCPYAAPLQNSGTAAQDTITKKKGDKILSDTTAFFKELQEVVVESSNIKTVGNEDIVTVTRKMRRGTGDAAELMGRLPGCLL